MKTVQVHLIIGTTSPAVHRSSAALSGSEIRVREAVCLRSMAFSRHIMSSYYGWFGRVLSLRES